jgi:hypothetical protein
MDRTAAPCTVSLLPKSTNVTCATFRWVPHSRRSRRPDRACNTGCTQQQCSRLSVSLPFTIRLCWEQGGSRPREHLVAGLDRVALVHRRDAGAVPLAVGAELSQAQVAHPEGGRLQQINDGNGQPMQLGYRSSWCAEPWAWKPPCPAGLGTLGSGSPGCRCRGKLSRVSRMLRAAPSPCCC